MAGSAKANAGDGPTPIPSNPEKAGRTTYARSGATVIGLFMPFAMGDKQIEEITIAPFDYGMTLRWRRGEFQSSTALLVELCVGMDEVAVMRIKYPDMDRIMFAFINALPQVVRDDILRGEFPPPQEPALDMMPMGDGTAVDRNDTFDHRDYPTPTRKLPDSGEDAPQPGGTAGTGLDLDG